MSQPSTTSAILTLGGVALLILLAAGTLVWLFTRPAPIATSTSAEASSSALPDGVYNIDDQLDKL